MEAQRQDEADYNNRRRKKLLRRRRAAQRADPLDITDQDFINKYHLSKEAFTFLCEELREHTDLDSSQRISLEVKVQTALFFYASGFFQRVVGSSKHISQKATSTYIEQVTESLIHPYIVNKFITFPKTKEKRNKIKEKFMNKYGIPGVVGCVAGSHIRIIAPSKQLEKMFYCRPKYYSLNIQMVCDSECRILAINRKYGGGVHDDVIWESSLLNEYMRSLYGYQESIWILGDSNFNLRPWLMTPVQRARAKTPEAKYNALHRKAMASIEKTFSQLKNRWRCIGTRALRYTPLKCANLIVACGVLHNVALDFQVPEPEGRVLGAVEFKRRENPEVEANPDLSEGCALREQLIAQLAR